MSLAPTSASVPFPAAAGQSPAPPAGSSAGGEGPEQALSRAQAAAQGKRLHEAAGICNDVLTASPDHPAAIALLGMIAAMGGDAERGIQLLRRAIGLRPGNAAWHAQLGSLCRMTCRLEEALAAGQESIRLDPGNGEHLVNLSLIFSDADDRERATACLLRAIGIRHDHADAHLAMAQTLLAAGDFEPGWIEYEWRNLTEAGRNTMPAMTSAPWNGMRIPEGRLLLVGDQGYGDTIQFARYIPAAGERVHEIVLGCSAEMEPLLARMPGVTQYCSRWNDVPGHAVNCRLSSLPYLFGTRIDSIPAPIPYITAPADRVAAWREKLANRLPAGVRRIGLAWTGRPTHPNDRRRSMALSRLLPLAGLGPAAFVSLQKPVPEADLPDMAHFAGMTDLSAELTDFGETAAVIENLDLVITVDTSMGHLAGAMGKPVWIMIAKAADWRWLLERDDSPWYPTARLFRQPKPGAWDSVVDGLAGALAEVLARPLAEPVMVRRTWT